MVDPKDVTIMLLDDDVAELRRMLAAVVEGEPGALDVARKHLEALEQVDREIEAEREMGEYFDSPICTNCDTFKGVGTAYCPECDKEALARLASVDTHPKGGDTTEIEAPF